MKKSTTNKSPFGGFRGLLALAVLSICHLTFNIGEANGQSWQWTKQIGGNINGVNPEDSRDEVYGLEVDKKGNSYILLRTCTDLINPNKIQADGNDLGSRFGGRDVALVSFDCTGKYRWGKVLGGKSNDAPFNLKIDTLGGIYISAGLIATGTNDSFMVDKDTTIKSPLTAPFRLYKAMAIIKYDSAGNYKWMRMPEPDTQSTFAYSRSYSIDVSPTGKVSLLTYINNTGAFASGSYIIPSTAIMPSMHILQYDANGNFIKGIPMNITSGTLKSLSYLRMAWDWKNDVYYIGAIKSTGEPPLSFGSTTQTGTNLLTKFSNTGSVLWVKQSTSTASNALPLTPVVEKNGDNIYLSLSERVGSSFNGFSVVNTYTTAIGLAALIKMNSAGVLQWGINVNAAIGSGGVGAAYAPDNKVAFFIATVGEASVGTNKILGSGSSAGVIQLIVEGTTGVVKSFDTLMGNNLANPNAFCSDAHGNFYSAYSYDVNLKVGSTTLGKYGGLTDIGFVKFGEASCDPIPTSIIEGSVISNVKIYPNPANDFLFVDGLQSSTELSLYNIVGQEVKQLSTQKNKEQISIGELPSGIYLMQLKTATSEVYTTKIVKE